MRRGGEIGFYHEVIGVCNVARGWGHEPKLAPAASPAGTGSRRGGIGSRHETNVPTTTSTSQARETSSSRVAAIANLADPL
jgi:hypothetical protein